MHFHRVHTLHTVSRTNAANIYSIVSQIDSGCTMIVPTVIIQFRAIMAIRIAYVGLCYWLLVAQLLS